MSFQKKLRARRAIEREAKRRKEALVESVRRHVVPALVRQGFVFAPQAIDRNAAERRAADIFPFAPMRRARPDGGVDLVAIQFLTYQRAGFRINACAVPKEGMMTDGGPKTLDECVALGVHDLETHARPWLRPALRAMRVEPLGQWFSVWHWPFRPPTQGDCNKLAKRVAGLLPEVETALREGTLGPHMRRMVLKPLPAEVLERIEKLKPE